jgi:L-fuculose-phosphate aldolase
MNTATNTTLTVLGYVRSPLKDRKDCPKQYSEGAPQAVIEIDPAYARALETLKPGQDILIFSWLHLSSRTALRVHPRGDTSQPLRGVFNTRSPDRPNPIGLHHCRILALDQTRITVDHLETLDGTPVVDIKPIAGETPGAENWGAAIPAALARELRDACAAGWRRGLFSGFNGNASLRLGDTMIITRSGAPKGFLAPGTLTTMNIVSGQTTGPGTASTEAAVHLEIYRRVPGAHAILHTHPPNLLALDVRTGDPTPGLPLYEAEAYNQKLAVLPPMQPGTAELGQAVGQAATTHPAVFMRRHGLVVHAASALEALALSEELDALASIRLRA